MITSDFGFSIKNYVGHYKMVNHNGNTIIVSEEFHPARTNEKELTSRILFIDDFKNNDYLLVNLANVDIKKDNSIIEFCNKYGLPYSSAMINDEQPGYYIMGLDVDEATYAKWYPYYRQDTMSRFEFCRHASSAKRLLNVKNEIEVSQKNPHIMLQYLLSLLLFERKHVYNFDEDDPIRETPTIRFQYYFLSVVNKVKRTDAKETFICDLTNFVLEIQNINHGTNKLFLNEQLKSDFLTESWNNLYSFVLCVLRQNTTHLNQITMDDFGNISLPNDMVITKDLELIMYDIAPIVLSDIINEGLIKVHPHMIITSNKNFSVDWQFKYQFEGLLMELLLMLSSGNQLRKCANPTCEKFFSPNTGHYDKIYCSHRCGSLVAKRKQRILDKENPNRDRLEPGFKNRQKKSR